MFRNREFPSALRAPIKDHATEVHEILLELTKKRFRLDDALDLATKDRTPLSDRVVNATLRLRDLLEEACTTTDGEQWLRDTLRKIEAIRTNRMDSSASDSNSRYHNQHNSSGPPPAAHFAAAAPPHIRRIDFALDASRWDSPAIDALSDTFAAYADVFSLSKLDYGEHSLRPFEIKVPSGTQPIQSRPYRFNPVLSKQVDAILDSYLAAALIQHSASPWSSPLVCVPKKSGGISITVNYKKLNKVTEIPQIAIPRVDEVLDTLGGGSVFSVFDLFSGFTQLTIHPDTIPLTAFCTPNGLYEWLRMPQGASGAPALFVSVMRDSLRPALIISACISTMRSARTTAPFIMSRH